MKKIDCQNCDSKEVPLNETLKIEGSIYCSNCFNSHFPDKDVLSNKSVVRELDPSVCFSCNTDFGNMALKQIAQHPICEECEAALNNKIFPTWVKAFFVGILAIVVMAFFWNWKFYEAYNNIKKANASFQVGDYPNASALMQSASEKVPEVEDLKTIADYFKGIDLLAQDKNAEALVAFDACKNKIPPDYNIHQLIIQAKIGVAFDNKDYQGFLAAAKENLGLDSTSSAISLTAIASAYACIYVDKGQEEAKQHTLEYLQKAKEKDSTSKEMADYYNKVEYRLETRNIISSKEFDKQFPNGWTKN